jgi:hypothetical protein
MGGLKLEFIVDRSFGNETRKLIGTYAPSSILFLNDVGGIGRG